MCVSKKSLISVTQQYEQNNFTENKKNLCLNSMNTSRIYLMY
jgi:hypothetical protein